MIYQVTEEQLFRAVKELDQKKVAELLPGLNKALAWLGVETAREVAHFIGQCAHESGGFRWNKEIWGPTPAQRRYEGRKDLGNIKPGWGRKYMGRDWIQLTGADNYRRFSEDTGLDAFTDPELLCKVENAWLGSAWWWKQNQMNKVALGTIYQVSKKVNGGTNGLDDRITRTEKACVALGIPLIPAGV
jgi:putative chitinase